MATFGFTPKDEQEELAPSALFMQAGDLHTQANSGYSAFDPDTWGEALSETAENAAKFVAGAVTSGVTSFANTGIAVANLAGADIEEIKVAEVLAEFDDDLGNYYRKNKEMVDLAGFVLGSIVPGMAGVRVLNAGQLSLAKSASTGLVGNTTSKFTGLLVPRVDRFIAASVDDIAKSSATFSWMSTRNLRVFGAGLHQSALESIAAEAFIAATMFKSPVLEDMELSDLAMNALVGVGVGTAIGGVIEGIKSGTKIKKGLHAKDLLEKNITFVDQTAAGTPTWNKVILAHADLEATPTTLIEGMDEVRFKQLTSSRTQRLQNVRRTHFQTLAHSDVDVANMVNDAIHGLPQRQVESIMWGMEDIGRVSKRMPAEAALAKDLESGYAITYLKLHGEDADGLFGRKPTVLNIADKAKNADEVQRTVQSYRHKTSKPYSVLKADDHFEVEARQIWADTADIKFGEKLIVGSEDLPILERAVRDKVSQLNIQEGDKVVKLSSASDIYAYTVRQKWRIAEGMRAKGKSIDEIAKVVNAKKSFLTAREVNTSSIDDIFAWQTARRKYTEKQIQKGLWSSDKGLIQTQYYPSYAKLATKIPDQLKDVDGHVLDSMAYMKAAQKVQQEKVDRAVHSVIGADFDRLYHPDESAMRNTSRIGSGPGALSFSDANYLTAGNWAEHTGAVTHDLIIKNKKFVSDTLEAPFAKLAADQDAAIEVSTFFREISATSHKYVYDDISGKFVLKELRDYQDNLAMHLADPDNVVAPVAPQLQAGVRQEIEIKNPVAKEAILAHRDVNARTVSSNNILRAAQGFERSFDPEVIYAPKPNPRDYNHFVFVRDDRLATGSAGRVRMIHAASEKELAELSARVPPEYTVISKGASEEYHKALGDYEWERSLHESYIDRDLRSRGINSPFFVVTDSKKVASDLLNYHLNQQSMLVREVMQAKFAKEFDELHWLGSQFTELATSRYASSTRAAAEATVKNPYVDYMKTALNITKLSEYPLLQSLDSMLNNSYKSALKGISALWKGTGLDTEKVTQIQEALEKHGVKSAYYDAATILLANHPAPRNILTQHVRAANAVLSTVILRLDFLNSLNNVVGSSILTSTELKYVMRAIEQGDVNAVGKLAELSKVSIPALDDIINSPTKLIAKSMQNFLDKEKRAPLLAIYEANGWNPNILAQLDSMLDDITLTGVESGSIIAKKTAALVKKAKEFTDVGERVTGNRIAEEMNRFVSADVARQITDIGVQAGVITKAEAKAVITKFVNRTQGNVIASQRPLMFQGAAGQAIGLFQTYQFNLMQQLFRYIGEGTRKDVAMLAGMQTTMYGLNGLPAFNFMNTHIVGSLSGNSQHRDIYDVTYGTVGKTVGDFLIYGLPSNLLATNLYTRGDINPRHPTILPVNPLDIPIVSATTKALKNIKSTLSQLGAGADVWQTVLQGIEHNGINRPLAGLGQVMQAMDGGKVFSTTSKGNVIGTNDFLSLATLSRLSGGKPLDEAIFSDEVYRILAYEGKDRNKREKLAKVMKSHMIAGGTPSVEEIESVAEKYVAAGGKQKYFNKWMLDQMTSANTAQANKIAENLKSPYSQKMQILMGGTSYYDLRDELMTR